MNKENNYIIRTIIRSPIVNFVFCGAFRSPNVQDMILIKEDSIELYSISTNGITRCISNQPLFSRIRDAKILKTIKKMKETGNKDIKEVDLLVTTNEAGYMSFCVYGLSQKNEYTKKNCQNIIIETLNIENRFYIIEEVKISNYGSKLRNMGYRIALEPEMRFIALTDALNTIEIFRLNPFIKKKESFIIERIKENLFGTILLMEFIKYLITDKFCYLVFYIISSEEKSYITLCRWNSEEPLVFIDFSTLISLPLFSDISIPIYLIPFFNSSGDFSLIYNNRIIYISVMQFFSKDSNFKCFDIKHKGIVTAYAIDENVYEDTNILYLGTDTGDLIYIKIKNQEIEHLNLGSIKPVGKAMEIISSLTISEHLIFISGDMCDNGIYLVNSLFQADNNISNEISKNTTPILIQSFPNWSPVCDFKVLEKETISIKETQMQNKKNRLYLCAGRTPEGKVAELKTGIKAKTILQVQDFDGIENFWIFKSNKLDSIYIIISFPWQTQLLELTKMGELYDRSNNSQLEQETSTISAGLFNDTHIVQIVQKKIKIFPLPDFQKLDSKTHLLHNAQFVISSSIHNSIITISMKAEDSILIYLIKLSITEQSIITLTEVGEPIKIVEEPSTITMVIAQDVNSRSDLDINPDSENIKPSVFLLIGTHKPSFIIFELSSIDKILMSEISLENFTNLADSIPESSCLLKTSTSLILLLGLRNGLLLKWEINHINENIELNFIDLNIFGSLPLKCVSNSQLSTAYIAGEEIWMINSHNNTMEIKEIVLDHQIKTHPTLILPFNDLLQQYEIKSFACISKETFLIVELDDSESVCIQYINIKENSRRILYDNNLKLMVVASDLSSLTIDDSLLSKRFQNSCDLKFINLSTGTIVSNNPLLDSKTEEYIFDTQETIYALSDWTIFYKNKSYYHIIVGTSIIDLSGTLKGNLHILVASYKQEKVQIKRINKISLDNPVYSISPIGKYGIAFSSNNIIFIKQFDVETRRYKLESPVISMKIKSNIIYASCQKNSVIVLSYDPIKNFLKPIMNDTTPRLSLDNFIIDDNIFCSDKERGLVCLTEDCYQERRLNLDFSVKLPTSISKFQKISGEKYYHPFIIGSGINGSFYSIMSCPKDDFEIYQVLISSWLQFFNTNSLLDKEKFPIHGESCLDGDFLEIIILYDWDNIPILSTILSNCHDDLKKDYILKIKLLRSIFSQPIF
ncbi:hypothetical protein T552_00162 [Pneumocystis carinii B80]|uniref:DNA damage-binding protein 1 n=1 Tax=Pneumocystis carinii (strain B80) TaxID=1408658 RepID=A0A0W4ZT31_PNEC8|nr:hypothetical protein T552_00162 [Pneumocystis carinii B80]KTW31520.1 hypothetical protein T552_00162 [Pneumocystis carinii B80]